MTFTDSKLTWKKKRKYIYLYLYFFNFSFHDWIVHRAISAQQRAEDENVFSKGKGEGVDENGRRIARGLPHQHHPGIPLRIQKTWGRPEWKKKKTETNWRSCSSTQQDFRWTQVGRSRIWKKCPPLDLSDDINVYWI